MLIVMFIAFCPVKEKSEITRRIDLTVKHVKEGNSGSQSTAAPEIYLQGSSRKNGIFCTTIK